jgi:crotonobetainyl-CoA:carnitine CoA-transferase CaiB-like acyl-CoA transferase
VFHSTARQILRRSKPRRVRLRAPNRYPPQVGLPGKFKRLFPGLRRENPSLGPKERSCLPKQAICLNQAR